MSTKHKRPRIVESDEEETTPFHLKQLEINDGIIEFHHTETQYVHRKNNDQARMLAVLNEHIEAKQEVVKAKDAVIEAKDAMIAWLNAENAKLRTQLFEEIKKDSTKTKRDIKDIKALLKKNT
jgi:hypothetical protein